MFREGVSISESTNEHRIRPIGVSAELIEQKDFTQTREDLTLSDIVAKGKAEAKVAGYNFSSYYLRDDGITLMDYSDGETYFVIPRNILDQRSRAPNGANHYPLSNRSYWEVQMIQVNKAYLENHGKYKAATRQSSSGMWRYNREENVTITFPDPYKIPEDYYKFKMTGKTTNGCEISFYL